MNKVFYKHTTLNNEVKTPVTLAALREGDKLNIAISICGTGEQFNKSLGRAISSGRLSKNIHTSIPIGDPGKTVATLNEFTESLRDENLNNIKESFGLKLHALSDQ
jgi:hypothetical protein